MKDLDWANIYSYPGYPAEPRPPPPPSPPLVTGKQQSQLETYAIHPTHAEISTVSPLSAASDRFCSYPELQSAVINISLSCLGIYPTSSPKTRVPHRGWTDICSPCWHPPCLSPHPVCWLFLLLCPQEESTDQVLGPSAFYGGPQQQNVETNMEIQSWCRHPADNS